MIVVIISNKEQNKSNSAISALLSLNKYYLLRLLMQNYAPEIINLVSGLDAQTKSICKDTRSIIQNTEFSETAKSRESCVVKLIKSNPELVESIIKPVYDWGIKARGTTLSTTIGTRSEQKSSLEPTTHITKQHDDALLKIKETISYKHINPKGKQSLATTKPTYVEQLEQLEQQRKQNHSHKEKNSHKGKGNNVHKR